MAGETDGASELPRGRRVADGGANVDDSTPGPAMAMAGRARGAAPRCEAFVPLRAQHDVEVPLGPTPSARRLRGVRALLGGPCPAIGAAPVARTELGAQAPREGNDVVAVAGTVTDVVERLCRGGGPAPGGGTACSARHFVDGEVTYDVHSLVCT